MHVTTERTEEPGAAPGQATAVNEALLISGLRQHELTETAEQLNVQLRAEIAERRKIEGALRDSEERYRTLFDSMDEGFCIVEMIFDDSGNPADYRFVEINPAFAQQTGLKDALGKTMRELAPQHEQSWFDTYGKIAVTGEAVRFVSLAAALHRWFDVYAFPVGTAENRRVGIFFNDISERKRIEVELNQAVVIAEKANRAKSDFLSSMSHELRTPLNAILGFAQLVESGTPAPTPLQKRNLQHILSAGWYLQELINEILDLALIESGKLTLSLEPVSLGKVLLECRAMIESEATKRGIQMTFPRFESPCFVKADWTRTKQVLVNLLFNAVKYNVQAGSIVVECSHAQPDSIRISVRDTGEGLAPEQLAQLFQPFNRLGKEATAEEGTGIGLVMTKRLVELMGGRIGADSTVGTGSVFWVELGLSEAPHAVIEAEPATPAPAKVAAGAAQRTVLYVEDNPANLELVEQLLVRRDDLHLLSATDARRGIELAIAHQPEVILMDINLPGMDGIEALKILRTGPATAHIPVIAVSARALPNDIESGLAAGFFDYITKPIKVSQFMNALDVALAFSRRTSPP